MLDVLRDYLCLSIVLGFSKDYALDFLEIHNDQVLFVLVCLKLGELVVFSLFHFFMMVIATVPHYWLFHCLDIETESNGSIIKTRNYRQ